MKKLFFYFILSTFIFLLWSVSGRWTYNREEYISNKVLDNSVPFDVKIDEEFLKSLSPADESSRTSTKRF